MSSNKREIVLDTETTGFSPNKGDKIVEIGCIELMDGKETGKIYQQYLNPMRDMPSYAQKVHGLSAEFLQDYPTIDEIIDDFLDFIQDSPLIIHNAPFDMRFLNYEMDRLEKTPIANKIIDTKPLAKSKLKVKSVGLDALCDLFHIDRSNRQIHGALLDCTLLSQVYAKLKE